VRYIATRSPISDPYARYLQAEKRKRADMMQKTKNWFVPWDSIYEANPQQILERHEPATLPPILIMQGSLDDNVLPALQEKFAATYRAAGGECKLEIFENCDHMWVADPGPQTDRAHEMLKDWIEKHYQ
jgi:alpha-beta hydrolase superfamily lysophospholipase